MSATADARGLAIQAHGLARRYGSIEAVADVSLRIVRGEFFALLGPSGCGKTTLLRLIAGLESLDAGTLHISGMDVRDVPANRRPVNTVFQSYALFPHMSVWENVAFGLHMKCVAGKELRERVTRMLDLARISELARRRPSELSGGQKQRVALARAAVNEPDVLLLDEPLGALDLKLRKQLQVELRDFQRRLGITFVYVTHDQEEAMVMSDRIAVMNGGRIEQLDTGRALYERPRTRFVAQFLGTCNLLEGIVIEAGDRLLVETEVGLVTAPAVTPVPNRGKRVTLALRPEKIRLATQGPRIEGEDSRPGEIMDVVYGGAETQFRIRVSNKMLFSTALNSGNENEGLCKGARVDVTFPPGAVTVLGD